MYTKRTGNTQYSLRFPVFVYFLQMYDMVVISKAWHHQTRRTCTVLSLPLRMQP